MKRCEKCGEEYRFKIDAQGNHLCEEKPSSSSSRRRTKTEVEPEEEKFA